MQISVTKKLGNTEFTFIAQGEDIKQVFEEAVRADRNISTKCGFCQSENLKLDMEQPEASDYPFFKIKCFDCFAYRKMGENKPPKKGWFFWGWEKYNKETRETTKLADLKAQENAPRVAGSKVNNNKTEPAQENTEQVSEEDLNNLPF